MPVNSTNATANSDANIVVVGPPRPAIRRVVSALVAFHVFAVFMAPFAMPPQTSELSGSVIGVIQPYVEGLGIANGYRFFSPEPGPSHLIRYVVTMPDGKTEEGVFPNRSQQFPRLLYHRYFMLTEFVNTLASTDTPEGQPPAPANELRGGERFQAYARGYAQHLQAKYNAKSVRLYLQRHYIPRLHEVQQGMQLKDKALYEEKLLFAG